MTEGYNPGMSLLKQSLWLIFTVLAMLCVCLAQPQKQSGIRGRIVDKERAPIGNAFVLVHSRQGGDKDLRSDGAGIYEIELLPGIYDVFISAAGFSPACKKIEVDAHKMTKFDVVLEVNALGMED